MALVAILVKDEDEGVVIDARGDQPLDPDAETLSPAQNVALIMLNTAHQLLGDDVESDE